MAIVSSFLPGLGGGTGKYAHELAHRLAAQCEVLLIHPGDSTGLCATVRPSFPGTPQTGDSTTRSAGGAPESSVGTLKYLTVTAAGDGDLQHILLNRATYRCFIAALDEFQPEIVHAHEPTPIAIVAQHWASLRRVPFVITFHVLPGMEMDFGLSDRVKFASLPVLHRVPLAYTRRFYRECAVGIMMHDEVRRRLDPDFSPARLFTIPSALDLARFSRCGIADPGNRTRNLCYVGFLSSRKNQRYLLDVMRYLPSNYRLWLVGRALVPAYERELREYARMHGLTNVEFLGEVADADLLDRLERTHVFVSASRLEVQAAVINEALASGTPVVALDNQTADLIDDRVGRRLPADAPPSEFAGRVQEICNLSRTDYEEMCREARARVRGMDWSATIKATMAAYDSALAQQTGPSSPRVEPGWARPRIPVSLSIMMAVTSGLYARSRRLASAGQPQSSLTSHSPSSP